MEILHWIKQGHSIHTTLRKAKEADPVAQLSLVPETRRKYLFPHRSYFPHFLKISENPYLHSNSYKAAFRDISSPLRTNIEASKKQSIVNQPLYITPFHAAKMVDPYLWNVKASRWTSVTDDDQLVSELLNSYFLHQYTAYLVFHKDYFLEDLAKGRTRFCSPLLVNAILAAACHASTSIPDRAKFWRPQNLAYQFLAEARRLWDMQHGKSSLTAIQAAIVLTIICNCDTLDKIGASYFLQAVAMAHDLKLFQSPPEKSISKKAQRAREFTAWSLFVWDSMTSFHYHRSPLYDQPPEFPLPSLDEDPSWYSEIYARYPLQSNIIPIGFGSYMKAWVKLHRITHDVARHYWGVTNGPFNDPLILRRRLDEWFHGLPERLSVENIILPMHLRIHLEYQCIRVELMRAETSSMPIPHSKPTSNLTQRDNDEVRRSYVHIETLIRLYYVHHNLEIFDPFMVILLVMLGNHVVEVLKDPTTIEDDAQLYRSTLILCARGLHAQGKSIYVGTMLYLMLSNAMEMHDKTLLKTYIHDDMSHDEDSLAQYNQSDFPVPIIKINEDRRTALLGDLVKAYETLSLDEDTASTQSSTLESP
ncbi:C6 transcription factor [Fusarium oxysporum f. sp. phaseoli]